MSYSETNNWSHIYGCITNTVILLFKMVFGPKIIPLFSDRKMATAIVISQVADVAGPCTLYYKSKVNLNQIQEYQTGMLLYF